MQFYVVGFAFDPVLEYVALIKKNRPAWQAGKLNGIGGHVEKNESFIDAMVREYKEETDVVTTDDQWKPVATLWGKDFEVKVYYAVGEELLSIKSMTDEIVGVYEVYDIVNRYNFNTISNLPWIISLIRDPDFRSGRIKPVVVNYEHNG
jgi:8-oxo-dGTP diphosphatase